MSTQTKPPFYKRPFFPLFAILATLFLSAITWAAITFIHFGAPPNIDYVQAYNDYAYELAGIEAAENNYDSALSLVDSVGRAQAKTNEHLESFGIDEWWKGGFHDALENPTAETQDVRLLLQHIEELEAAGAFDNLEQLLADPYVVEVMTPVIIDQQLPELGSFRHLAQIRWFQIERALAEQSSELVYTHACQLIDLSQTCLLYPSAIPYLTGLAIEDGTMQELQAGLHHHQIDQQGLQKLVALIHNASLPPVDQVLEGERLTLCNFFAKNPNLHQGSIVPKVMSAAAQIDNANQMYNHFASIAKLPPAKRLGTNDFEQQLSRTPITRFNNMPTLNMLPVTDRFLSTADAYTEQRRGTLLLAAIELHRSRTGSLPASLNDLVPSELPELPQSLFAESGFVYKRIDPATDPHNRDYLLYSVGFDGQDNNATTSPSGNIHALHPSRDHQGYDYIVNHIEPSE